MFKYYCIIFQNWTLLKHTYIYPTTYTASCFFVLRMHILLAGAETIKIKTKLLLNPRVKRSWFLFIVLMLAYRNISVVWSKLINLFHSMIRF